MYFKIATFNLRQVVHIARFHFKTNEDFKLKFTILWEPC